MAHPVPGVKDGNTHEIIVGVGRSLKVLLVLVLYVQEVLNHFIQLVTVSNGSSHIVPKEYIM